MVSVLPDFQSPISSPCTYLESERDVTETDRATPDDHVSRRRGSELSKVAAEHGNLANIDLNGLLFNLGRDLDSFNGSRTVISVGFRIGAYRHDHPKHVPADDCDQS